MSNIAVFMSNIEVQNNFLSSIFDLFKLKNEFTKKHSGIWIESGKWKFSSCCFHSYHQISYFFNLTCGPILGSTLVYYL
mgnify:CR=1 FL=1